MRHGPTLLVVLLALLAALPALGGCAGTAPLRPQAAALNSRGAALLAAGDLPSAAASFRAALEYNQRFAEPHNNLGLVALAQGHVLDAREHFRDALRLNRDFAEAWANLGVALSRSAGPDDREFGTTAAIAAYHEALAVDPGLIEARVDLVRALLASGRTMEALEQSRRLTQIAETLPIAHALRAGAALSARRWTEAAVSVRTARALSPDDPTVALLGAMVDIAQGATDAAWVALDDLSSNPEFGSRARELLRSLERAEGLARRTAAY